MFSLVRRREPLRLTIAIPDFISIIGYLDNVIIVPAGILLAVKLVPAELMREFRASAANAEGERALGRRGAAIVIVLWVAGGCWRLIGFGPGSAADRASAARPNARHACGVTLFCQRRHLVKRNGYPRGNTLVTLSG